MKQTTARCRMSHTSDLHTTALLSAAMAGCPALFDAHRSESLRVDCSGSTHGELIDRLKTNRLLTLPHVERILRSVDRSHFIPTPPHPTAVDDSHYYRDSAQPIGSLATIASPSAHCIALQALFPTPPPATSSLRCLDIGSGSGYLTLCLALLAGETGRVWGVEHAEALAVAADANVRRAGHAALLDSGRLTFVSANGMLGLPSQQPFDVINCGAAVDGAKASVEPGDVAGCLLSQLSDGGLLLIPEIERTEAVDDSSAAQSKWAFTFTAASQSLKLYQRLPSSDSGPLPAASSHTASSSLSLPRYTVRRLMHCSYSPMRAQPPPVDIDSLAAFQQRAERLAAEVSDCERRVRQWHERFKSENGRGASELDRADATMQALLHEWRAKSVQLAQWRQVEAQLQQTAPGT